MTLSRVLILTVALVPGVADAHPGLHLPGLAHAAAPGDLATTMTFVVGWCALAALASAALRYANRHSVDGNC